MIMTTALFIFLTFPKFQLLHFYIFTETLEKLAKREKEVSTLTTQVDDLKTQITGNEYILHAGSFATMKSQLCFSIGKNTS